MSETASIMFFDEVCERLRVSQRTGKRLRRVGAFPIPELPRLDKRPRFSSRDVEAYLNREHGLTMTRRRVATS